MNNVYSDHDILEARAKLWHLGNIEWKLDPTQKKILDFVKSTKGKISVINCARRLGKSYFLTIMAIQQCLTKPKSIVKFLQPEQKMIRMNIKPIIDSIFQDCPTELRPEFKTQDNIYIFKHNGSQIQLAGTDSGNAEKLRGGDSDLCIIDEAAFVKGDLPYIIRSILVPTTLLTRGKIILSSTSPITHDHDFAKYMERAEENGTLIRKTIYDALEDSKHLPNPRFTQEILQEIIAEYPEGEKSDDFRRECLCQIITDGSNSVFPEFTDEVIAETVVEWPRPAFADNYVSMDIGFKDLTVVLFAYFDFMNGVIVIEDEVVMNGSRMTTDVLAQSIIKKEKELWTNNLTNEFQKPYIRISDNNYIVLNDLQRLHGLNFLPTNKDNKDAAVNNARMMIGSHQIIINPRCKILISHLRNATWDKNRQKFTRNKNSGHHYDAADSFLYLVRNIDKNKNPYPKGYKFKHLAAKGDYFVNPNFKDTNSYDGLKDLFKPRKPTKN